MLYDIHVNTFWRTYFLTRSLVVIGYNPADFVVTGEIGFGPKSFVRIIITDMMGNSQSGGKESFTISELMNPDAMALIQAELDLQKSPYFDPNSRVNYNPTPVTNILKGQMRVTADTISAQLSLEDLKGNVILSSTKTSTFKNEYEDLNVISSAAIDLADKIRSWNLPRFKALEFEAEIEWEPHPAHWGSKSRVSCQVPLQEEILKVSTDAGSCLKICEPWQPCQNTIPVGDNCKLFKGLEKGLTIWTGSAPLSFDSFTFINNPGEEAIETQLKPGNLSVWLWFGPDAKSIANYYNINNTTRELGSNLITKLQLSHTEELVTIKYTDAHGCGGQKTHSTCSFVTGILHLLMNLDPRKREILLSGSDGLCCFSLQLINHFMNDWKLEANSEESTFTKEYSGSWAFPIADTQCVVKGKIKLKLIDP
jgi:hypothetical protein